MDGGWTAAMAGYYGRLKVADFRSQVAWNAKPAMANSAWDRELRVLTEAIRRLSAEYDAFLYGSVARPPIESRRHVEEMFRRLTLSPSESAADRYQLSTLQGRFFSLCERWERLQGEKEAGRRPGIHGGFVSAVSPEPLSRRESAEKGAPPNLRPNAGTAGSVKADRGSGGLPPSRDREVFERYIAAKRARGEEVADYGFEPFLARLADEREKLKQRLGATEVDFEVAERDGRVKLVAKPRTGPRPKVQGPK
jgi:hypothetical protein